MLHNIYLFLSNGIKQYCVEGGITLLILLIGWEFGRRRASKQWRTREFLGRLNISLNAFHEGRLLIRTVLEKPIEEIFINSLATKRILAAAQQTDQDNPLLPLDPVDRWPLLNSVLNEISERFIDGQIRRELGYPIRSERFLLCLTCECHPDIKTKKVRVMLIKKQLLINLQSEEPSYESPQHALRFATLKTLRNTYFSDPSHFIEVELAL